MSIIALHGKKLVPICALYIERTNESLHKKMKFPIKYLFSKCDQIAVFYGFGHIF